MDEKVVAELTRRCENIIKHAEPDCVEHGMTGSLIRFNMSLCPVGYPFNPSDAPSWMTEDFRVPVMTEEEFRSDKYDELFIKLHDHALNEVNNRE